MTDEDQTIKGYVIQEQIGQGGFGAVYRAFQPIVQREVAIKAILPQYANKPDFIRDFETEAQLVARLEHPFIVPLFDYWRDPQGAYLVMRWLRGGSLSQRLQHGGLAPDVFLKWLNQITDALALAHRAGVIHRDIKPDNILLDEESNAYLTDFGLATLVGVASEEDTTSGSIPYMAPEQLSGMEPAPEADIYSLGIVLYQMLTGQHPYGNVEKMPLSEVIAKALDEPLPSLNNNDRNLPAGTDQVLAKATAKRPAERYNNVQTLAQDLTQAFLGQTATAVQQRLVKDADNPYKGLRYFAEADAKDFFGREVLIAQLIEALQANSPFQRFLSIVGSSGSGKSSVVFGGLLPALRRGVLTGADKWFIVEFVSGANPMQKLEAALLSIAADISPQDVLALQTDPLGLVHAAAHILAELDSEAELLIVIDQFEEVFTHVKDEAERVQFLKLLHGAVTAPDSRVRIIVTLRADFYHKPLSYETMGELIQQRTQVVLPLTTLELEQAITAPAKQIGLQVDTDLVAAMTADLRDEPGALPLLQYALTEVFFRRDGNRLTLKAYQESGGVLGALARRAEEVYSSLSPEHQAVARQVFLRLVSLGEGTEDTRLRAYRADLAAVVEDTTTLQTVLDAFGKYRLLTFDQELGTRQPMVEVAHEAIIREWGQLRAWINESRNDVRLQQLLASAAQEWRNHQQQAGYLLHGGRLSQFEEWVADSTLVLTQNEQEYLAASLKERDTQLATDAERRANERRLEQRARQRLRLIIAGLLLASVAGIILTTIIFNESRIAQRERDNAEFERDQAKSLALSANAQNLLSIGQPDVALALALAANAIESPPPEARLALADTVSFNWMRHRFHGHTSAVTGVAISPDGQVAVSASADNSLLVWDIAERTILRALEGHTDEATSVAISPDGQQAVSGSDDGTLILWDIASGQALHSFEGHTDNVNAVAFSPDGLSLLSGSDDGTLILWDIEAQQPIRTYEGHEGAVFSVAFSPDGLTLLSGAEDNTVILWDAESGELLQQLGADGGGHTGTIYAVTFSPDGRTALSGADDGVGILWDVADGSIRQRLVGHANTIRGVTFSPDGRQALTASSDNTLILWDIATGESLRTLRGHTARVGGVAFLPDGNRALSASSDNTLIEWEIDGGEVQQQFVGHNATIYAIDFNPNGQTALSGAEDNELIYWDLDSGNILWRRIEHEDTLYAVDISPDGLTGLSAGQDFVILRWDLATGEVIQRYEGHTNDVNAAIFSPDGQWILSGSQDNTMILWDVESGEMLQVFEGHTDEIRSVAFSPDSKTALSGSDDSTLILWDINTGEILRRFEGHTAIVRVVAFSPSGVYAFSASADRTLLQWDVATGDIVQRFLGHSAAVRALGVVSDRMILSGSDDKTLILWDVETGDILRRFQGQLTGIRSLAVDPTRNLALSGADDDTALNLLLWDITPYPDGLMAWALDNRDILELTCEQRIQYRIEPLCGE